jgi:hypothetical protein
LKYLNNYRLDGLIFCIFILIFISPIIGFRDISVGADTHAYTSHIATYLFGYDNQRMEPGIYMLANLSGIFSKSPQVFFTFHFILLSSLMILAYRNFVKDDIRLSINFQLITFTFFLVCSKWFYVGSVNSLRQSIACAFVFLGLSYYKKNNFKMFLGIIFGGLWHISIFLFLPFLVLLRLKTTSIFILFILFSFFYVTGLNGEIVKLFSNLIGIPLYEFIYTYAGSEKYMGFQWDFFLYTIFWPISLWVINNIAGPKYLFKYNNIIFKIYLILCLSYFFFGFGPYVTRYAYPAWLFLPFLFTFYISSISVRSDQKKILFLLCLPLGFAYYLSLITNVW